MNDNNGNEILTQAGGAANAVESGNNGTGAANAVEVRNDGGMVNATDVVNAAAETAENRVEAMADTIMADFIKETSDNSAAETKSEAPQLQTQQTEPKLETAQEQTASAIAPQKQVKPVDNITSDQQDTQLTAQSAQQDPQGQNNVRGQGAHQQGSAQQNGGGQGIEQQAAQGQQTPQGQQGQTQQNVAQGTQAQQGQAQPMPRAISEAEWKELVEAHPEVVGTKLPDDIFRACLMSKHSPLHVYDSMMLKQTQNQLSYLLSENARLKQDLDNFRRAPVMPMAGGAPDTKPKDEILEAFMKYQ